MTEAKTIELRMPDDMHVHLRDEDMLREVIRYTALQYGRAIVMPNLKDNPVLDAFDASAYRQRILDACFMMECSGFEPLMTIYLTKNTTPDMIAAASVAGVQAVKFYPRHGTTNSDHGLPSVRDIPDDVLEAMAFTRMVLCVHAEKPEAFIMDRERLCIPDVLYIAGRHPNLRVVWEHVSCMEAVEIVKGGPSNLFASITAHHLVLTMDDVVGRNHHHCMPAPKSRIDRDAIVKAAISGNPKFFFGSDSAPHPTAAKESAQAPAGVFTAPMALPLLAQVFEQNNALDKLEAFTSKFGADCYELPYNEGKLVLERGEHVYMPRMAGVLQSVRPFRLGEKMDWRVIETPRWKET